MKTIKISVVLNKGLLYFYYGLSAIAIATLILYFAMYAVKPTREIGIALSGVFCITALLFCGWKLQKYWKKPAKKDFIEARYLWLGISCGLLYICVQMLNWGLWLWIPSIAFLFFYILFVRDEIRTFLDWKRNVKITW